MEKKNKSLTKIKELPLAKLLEINNREPRQGLWSPLYKIDQQLNGVWTCIEKGIIDSKKYPLPENQRDSVYSKYAGDENYRLVIYNSILPTFPEEILTDRRRLLKTKVTLLKEGIKIAKESGFVFDLVEYKINSSYIPSRIQSKTTGLIMQRSTLNLKTQGYYFIHLFDEAFTIENRLFTSEFEILLNTKSLEQLIIDKLEFMLATLNHELADLNHRIESKNTRRTTEVLSSIWHASNSEIKSIYLLEFGPYYPHFMKWKVQKIEGDYTFYKKGTKELFLQDYSEEPLNIRYIYDDVEEDYKLYKETTLYLEHGSNKYVGIPYASFGLIDSETETDNNRELDYYNNRFVEEINEIDIIKDVYRNLQNKNPEKCELMRDLANLGLLPEKHENLRNFCHVYYHEGDHKTEYFLNNLLDDIYGNPLYEAECFLNSLLDDIDDNPMKGSIHSSSKYQRVNRTLNYVEDRQKTNSIWKVLEMD